MPRRRIDGELTSFKLDADLRAAILVEFGKQGMAAYLRRVVRDDLERRGQISGRADPDEPVVASAAAAVTVVEEARNSPIPGVRVKSPPRKSEPRLRDHPAHRAWASMRKNSRDIGYPITPKWEDFWVFVKDMGSKPADAVLVRQDQNRGWTPDNCAWGTKADANRRRNTTGRYTFNGQTKTWSEWSNETNINVRVLRARWKLGWPMEEVLGTPVGPGPGKRGNSAVSRSDEEPTAPVPTLGRRRMSRSARNPVPLKRRDSRYFSWKGMRERCGETGDTHVPEWEEFWVFARDLGERPPGSFLLRRDMSVPYGPKNCFWGTKTQANRGRRFVRRYVHDGREMTVAELAQAAGLGYKTLDARLRKGMPLEKALSPEVRPGPGRPRP